MWVGPLFAAASALNLVAGCETRVAPPEIETARTNVPELQRHAVSDGAHELTHDFGVIQPNVTEKCRFEIANPTSSPWTFKQTNAALCCVRPTISGPLIDAGGVGWVDVSYKAPAKEGDDLRAVDVVFTEPDAPSLRLLIRAAIREQLYAFPESIDYSGVGPDKQLVANLQVRNYSGAKWHRLFAQASEAWINLDVGPELPVARQSGDAPLEAWMVAVAVDPGALTPGMHGGTVRLSGDGYHRDVPVKIEVLPPIAAIPSQLFFGRVAAGQLVERHIALMFTEAAAPAVPASISTTHGLANDLEVSIEKGRNARHFRLLARFHPVSLRGSITGTLHVTAGDHGIEIPVIASVDGGAGTGILLDDEGDNAR